jgi:hypothetical protein
VAEAEKWKKEFRRTIGGQHPKGVELLEKDWQLLTAYYAFPKEHWTHLRTTNVIESPFSAVRLTHYPGGGAPVAWIMWPSFASSQLTFVGVLDGALGMQECMQEPVYLLHRNESSVTYFSRGSFGMII